MEKRATSLSTFTPIRRYSERLLRSTGNTGEQIATNSRTQIHGPLDISDEEGSTVPSTSPQLDTVVSKNSVEQLSMEVNDDSRGDSGFDPAVTPRKTSTKAFNKEKNSTANKGTPIPTSQHSSPDNRKSRNDLSTAVDDENWFDSDDEGRLVIDGQDSESLRRKRAKTPKADVQSTMKELTKMAEKDHFQDRQELEKFRGAIITILAAFSVETDSTKALIRDLDQCEYAEIDCDNEDCQAAQRAYRRRILKNMNSIVTDVIELRRRMTKAALSFMTGFEHLMDKDSREKKRLGDEIKQVLNFQQNDLQEVSFLNVRRSTAGLESEAKAKFKEADTKPSTVFDDDSTSPSKIIITIRACIVKGCYYYQPVTSGNNFASHFRRFHPSLRDECKARLEGNYKIKQVTSAGYQQYAERWNYQKNRRQSRKEETDEEDEEIEDSFKDQTPSLPCPKRRKRC